jgi:shikimate dehydrogenase
MSRRVSLLGKPLKRRHSVVMHNAAFEAAGIDARYELQELDPEQLEGFVEQARGPGFLGLGVTAPYKKRVAELVDVVEPDAVRIGAVNNVVRTDDGRLVGFNTDAPGFRAGAERALGRPLAGASVVVVGAGGVAQAIVDACREAGVGRLTVANRSLPASPGGVEAVALDSDELEQALASADLAVNATTVGMVDSGMALPVDALPADATVFDVVYVPAETELLRAARGRGLRAANGSEMLIAQAAIAFERWTGVGGMADVMRQAVAPLLADPSVRA